MNIVIDARYLSNRYSGIATYSQSLIEHLAMSDTENSYRVLVHRSFKGRIAAGENFEFVPCKGWPVSFRTLFRMGKYIRSFQADVYHSLFPMAPLGLRAPLLVTLHDLQPFWDPRFSARRPRMLRAAYDRFYRWVYPATLRAARWIITDSEATRAGVRDLFPDLAHKTIVVPLGLSESAFLAPAPTDIEQVRARYNLDSPYFLYYGSTRPNKNLPRLAEAFGIMRRTHPEAKDLLLVMAVQPDRFFSETMTVIRRWGLRGDVRILQPVSESERRALLAAASVFCFPSQYEGFGLPVLEAQAANVPVLASNSAALPETGGEGAVYVNAKDSSAIAQQMFTLHNDVPLRRSLILKGRANCLRFSWAETAARTLEIYRLLF